MTFTEDISKETMDVLRVRHEQATVTPWLIDAPYVIETPDGPMRAWRIVDSGGMVVGWMHGRKNALLVADVRNLVPGILHHTWRTNRGVGELQRRLNRACLIARIGGITIKQRALRSRKPLLTKEQAIALFAAQEQPAPADTTKDGWSRTPG
jgi:hypothetical protein